MESVDSRGSKNSSQREREKEGKDGGRIPALTAAENPPLNQNQAAGGATAAAGGRSKGKYFIVEPWNKMAAAPQSAALLPHRHFSFPKFPSLCRP